MAAEGRLNPMTFENDLETLAESDRSALPVREMRMRFVRSWGPENSLWQMAAGRRENSSLKVMLYPVRSSARDRPTLEFFVDPMIDLEEHVAQRATCRVLGWPHPGRAVLIDVGGVSFWSATPCRPPLLGKRFGSD